MSETFRINRFIQFIYSSLILIAALLTWNTAGQVRRVADLHFPLFKNQSPVNVIGTGPFYCSANEIIAPKQQSCSLQ